LKNVKLNKIFILTLIILVLLPANIFIFANDIKDLDLKRNYKITPFLDQGIYNAINWLDEDADEDKIVFCDWNIGNYVPSISGNTVFVGHWPQTIDFYQKQAMVAEFFSVETNGLRRMAIMKYSRAGYVFYSFKEKSLGGFDPDGAGYLSKVYDKQGVKIYKVLIFL
jgi:uncharacterized membrane protein